MKNNTKIEVVLIMNPISLCLVQMGKSGLEVVESYPKVIPEEQLTELSYKSVPLTAKPGDYATTSFGSYSLSSFVFEVPVEGARNNIGSLVAVFSSQEYDTNIVRKVFSVVVTEMRNKKLLQVDTLQNILPNIYKGFLKEKFTIEISSVAKISFDFSEEASKEKKTIKKRANDVSNELWK